MFHPLLECRGPLLLPPSLQGAVMFSHHHRAVALVFTQTFTSQQTIVALSAEFESVVHFAPRFLLQAAALGIEFSSRTNRLAFLHLDLKVFDRESAVFLRRGLSRANDLPALALRLDQLLGRDIGPIHILYRRFVQPHLRL